MRAAACTGLGAHAIRPQSAHRHHTTPLVLRQSYVKAVYGSLEDCKKAILADFFKHGFDGSGADNFYDAGSCIDGRLTSAWNWCSKISKKPYYHIFKMAGFVGFDGDFNK